MTTYVNYEFYSNSYHGTMAEDDFNREVVRASAYIGMITMNRITDSVLRRFSDEIKLATCAACEVYYAAEKGGEIASESVGSWSRTYSNTGTTTQQKLQDAVEPYLIMTGLLFRGARI